MQSIKSKKIILIILIIAGYVFLVTNTRASRIDDLKVQIEERNRQIEQIQKEIDQYQAEIDKNSKQASSLKNEILKLETIRKKLITDISLTQKKIELAQFNIEQISFQIDDKEKKISDNEIVMAELIRNMNGGESMSTVELILSNDKFSDFFGDIQRTENFQKDIGIKLDELKNLKNVLEKDKIDEENEKNNLEKMKSMLSDQKQLVDINTKNKNMLLVETKNKETTYKKLLADRLAKQQALEDEIKNIEEQIRITIDPNSLPAAGSGVLKWPLDLVMITQYFGNTSFATQNPQIYNGNGHNGVDFRATPGTPIKSSLNGRVRAMGDTDSTCRGVSYGKWILIDHPNNLSTLYAHLSLIKVSPGQQVETGQVIGYSGDTGYTTGPHLHFGVFATPGVQITRIQSKICGTMMRLPVASFNSYLNPLSYL